MITKKYEATSVADYAACLKKIYSNEAEYLAQTFKKLVKYHREELKTSEKLLKDFCARYFDSCNGKKRHSKST